MDVSSVKNGGSNSKENRAKKNKNIQGEKVLLIYSQ
jgi:hypothetical protein